MKKQTYSVEIFKPKIGIKLIREEPQNFQILTIDDGQKSNPEIQQWVIDCFTQLCIRIRKAINHVIKLQFISNATPIQQKGRRTEIHLQERVEIELNKLIHKKHNKKLFKCSDKQSNARQIDVFPSVCTISFCVSVYQLV